LWAKSCNFSDRHGKFDRIATGSCKFPTGRRFWVLKMSILLLIFPKMDENLLKKKFWTIFDDSKLRREHLPFLTQGQRH